MRFTISNVVGNAFSSIGKAGLPLLGATVLFYLLPNLLMFGGLRYALGPAFGTLQQYQGQHLIITAVTMLVTYVFFFVHMGAVYEICILTTAGKPVRLGQVFAHNLMNAVPIFVIYLLCVIGWFLCSVLLFIPALIFLTFYSVVVPAYVAEKPGIFGAFSRSQTLTKGHRWGIFGLWILILVIFYALMMAIEIPVMMPMFQASMRAAQLGRTVTPMIPSFGVMAALSLVFSAMWVVVLSLNASVYSCLRAEKDKMTGASLEKVFE